MNTQKQCSRCKNSSMKFIKCKEFNKLQCIKCVQNNDSCDDNETFVSTRIGNVYKKY